MSRAASTALNTTRRFEAFANRPAIETAAVEYRIDPKRDEQFVFLVLTEARRLKLARRTA